MIGAPIGAPIGAYLTTAFTSRLLIFEAADVFALFASSRVPSVVAPGIRGGSALGPISAGRASSGISAGSGRSTIRRAP